MKRSLLLAIVLFCAEILFAQKGKEEAGIIFNPLVFAVAGRNGVYRGGNRL